MVGLFRERMTEGTGPVDDSWRRLLLTGIPKKVHMLAFQDLRWICRSPGLQKSYLGSIVAACIRHAIPSPVRTLGFKPRMRVDFPIELIRQCLHLADLWSGLRCVVVSRGVAFAFDCISHMLMPTALHKRGIPVTLINALMQEMCALEADMTVYGVGTTNAFPYERGGRQGGKETPQVFNWIMELLMAPAVDHWTRNGYGFSIDGCQPIHHVIWCDNVLSHWPEL